MKTSDCRPLLNFVLLFLILAASANGQPKCKVETYSTEQGLSHQRVTCIMKDREGFMWFGSWDGINRFNGHEFLSYKSSAGDSSPLKNDRIDQIVEDGAGYLWILAYDNQVHRFDKKKERFLALATILKPNDKSKTVFSKILTTTDGSVWLQSVGQGLFCVSQNDSVDGQFIQYKKGGAERHQLPSNTINFFHEDREQQIWIGTPEGLCCLAKTEAGPYQRQKMPADVAGQGVNITAFDEDDSFLYFCTAAGSLIRYDKRLKNFRHIKITVSRINDVLHSKKSDVIYATTSTGELLTVELENQRVRPLRFPTGESLLALYEDGAGDLWIEPQALGVIRFDPLRRSFQHFSKKNQEGLNPIGNRFGILEDNHGTIWINMKGGSFGYFNRDKQAVEYTYTTPDEAAHPLPRNITTFFYDNAGILWLTTYERELIKIILQGDDFRQQLLAAPESSISENEVRGVLYDNKGRLWLGAKSGQLHVYLDSQKISRLFENEPKQGIGLVYSIFQDSKGNIWLGTKGDGLYKASPINPEQTRYRLAHYRAGRNDPDSLPGNDIYSLVEDRQGRIWIGSFDNGLSFVSDDQNFVKFVHNGDIFEAYPKDAFRKIRHLALDGSGNLWVGTTDGLLLLDLQSRTAPLYSFKTYQKTPGDEGSLGNNDVQFIYRDAKNRMWLATSGGGIVQAIGIQQLQSLRFRNFTTKDGMPNDYVLSCSEDKDGNLWIATENGLTKFNAESRLFRNYDSYDGLPKASFSEAAVSRNPGNGSLVFGTTKGFLAFAPARIGNRRITANIAFTNLRINNEDAGPQKGQFVLECNVNYLNNLTLKYNQNIISIGYSILDYRAGGRQSFGYRLIGFDTAWHDDRQLRRATYTALPPGDYVFEVRSLSTDLYFTTPYKRLAITILPPPWKTWWAYALYAIAVGVIFFFIRRNALVMIRLRNKIIVEQKLAELKLNFFTNVSHELRTPLTLIINPLEQVSRKEDLSPEASSHIETARKNAGRMLRFVNQLLDLRKVQSDKAVLRISRVEMVTFVKKISDHFTEAARSKRIKLDIISESKELVAWVDAEKLDVVVYNLLGNALKFTPEGKAIQVRIQSFPKEEAFSISVYDQGPGVPKEKLEEIFELFQEGDAPDNRELKGTGIGLALSREFVNLHGGELWAANNEDGGLLVTVKLKLSAKHFKPGAVSFVDLPKTPVVHQTPIKQQVLRQPHDNTAPVDREAPLVLLVEDNEELRSFLKGQLGEFYRVETARDGREGFEKAVDIIPDLILSDIMMPVMDGIQLLDMVKNELNTSHIPVVLLSAKYSIESQMEGLQYGADLYITKPFNNEFLIASIDNLLRQRKKMFESLVEKKNAVKLSPSLLVITSKDEAFLKVVISVVEEKMADFDFNVESLAKTMTMHPKSFYKKFKSLTGLAPVEFLRDMRLQRAAQLLHTSGMNIAEVAYEVGFNNPKYFSTCFKEKYHTSPSEYQKFKENPEMP